MAKDFFDSVSADKTQLGFEYQDFVCLEYLIDMKPGEVVGLEVLDDIHHVQIDGNKKLIQIKHSVNDENNLTNRDIDLWKTLYNWSFALDKLGADNLELIIFTNKGRTKKDGIVQLLCDEPKNISRLLQIISTTKSDLDSKEAAKEASSSKNPIKKYVDHIFNLNEEKKTLLLDKIKIIFSESDIFTRLAKKIEFFSIESKDAEKVVDQLMGVFKRKKYELLKSGNKLSIDYSKFRNEFQFDRIVQLSRSRDLDFSRYHSFKKINDIDPKDGLFARQLADINISNDKITEHAIDYATTNMFIQKLISNGEFSEVENTSILDEIFDEWELIHDHAYDQDDIESDERHCKLARNCFHTLVGKTIDISNTSLPRAMTIGKSIELSDVCRIGWKKNWKELYGKDVNE